MLRIIVTGGIAVGKTAVTTLFSRLGVVVFDADRIGRLLLKTEKIKKAIFNYFGNRVFDSNSEIDRSILGDIIFSNLVACRFVEDLLHPLIRLKIDYWSNVLAKNLKYKKPYYLVSIPIFIENRYPIRGERVLVVDCEDALRKKRLERRGYSPVKIDNILKKQLHREEWWRVANNIIENNENNFALLERKIRWLDQIYRRL